MGWMTSSRPSIGELEGVLLPGHRPGSHGAQVDRALVAAQDVHAESAGGVEPGEELHVHAAAQLGVVADPADQGCGVQLAAVVCHRADYLFGTDGLAGVEGQDLVDRGGLVHGAVGLDVVEPGHRDHVPLGVGIQRRQVVRGDRVVVVDQGDECAAGQRDPGVACTPDPGVVEELHDPPGDPRVRRGVLGDQLAAAVRGAVEDDDHLEQVRVHRLRRQRVQARTQIGHTLKARHHHRDTRHELVLGGRGHGGHYAPLVGVTSAPRDGRGRSRGTRGGCGC